MDCKHEFHYIQGSSRSDAEGHRVDLKCALCGMFSLGAEFVYNPSRWLHKELTKTFRPVR